MNKKRFGRFWITRDSIENHHNEIVELFSELEIVVVRAEMLYHKDQIEYIGVSPNFREVEPYTVMPDYELIVSIEDGIKRFEAREYNANRPEPA